MSDHQSSRTHPKIRRRRPNKSRRASELITALSIPGPTARPATAPPLPTIIADDGTPKGIPLGKIADEVHDVDVMLEDSGSDFSMIDADVESVCEPTSQDMSNSVINRTTGNLHPSGNASFMGLPSEIRQMIFAYVLTPYNPKGYSSMIYGHGGKTPRVLGRGHGQICRLNRQCYNESIDLLYAQTLVFLNHETMTGFFQQRTTKQLSQLRSIHMLVRCTDWTPAIEALVLPHETSLRVEWPIEKKLWTAMGANKSICHRRVHVRNEMGQKWVLFESRSTPSGPNPKCTLPPYKGLCKRFELRAP